MHKYKVMAMDGKEVEISSEVAEHLMKEVWADSDKKDIVVKEYLKDYEEKAIRNINDVACEDRDYLTEDILKKELAEALESDILAELIVEGMEYMQSKLLRKVHEM